MGQQKRGDKEQEEESRRILERVERDSSDFFLRGTKRARDHFAANDAQHEDWTELWGRRIGRTLGLGFAIVLIVWLWLYLTRGA